MNKRGSLVIALLLLAATIAAIVTAALADMLAGDGRAQTVVRAYFGALEASDGSTALDQIVPEARLRSGAFVQNGLGNRYRVVGIAVEQASVLKRLVGHSRGASSVTTFLDITQADGTRWQAGPRVPLVRSGDRWYLARPPLMPED